MNDNEITERQVFYGQWTRYKRLVWCLTFRKPTCTVPDQSMSIQEIIAKYTRTGLVPQSALRKDEGGQSAFDPDFDPLDNGQEFMEQAKPAPGSGEDPSGDPSSEPSPEPSPEPLDSASGAGEGGE